MLKTAIIQPKHGFGLDHPLEMIPAVPAEVSAPLIPPTAVRDFQVAGFARIQETEKQRPEVWRHQLRREAMAGVFLSTIEGSHAFEISLVLAILKNH